METAFLKSIIETAVVGYDIDSAKVVLSQFGDMTMKEESDFYDIGEMVTEKERILRRLYSFRTEGEEFLIAFFFGDRSRRTCFFAAEKLE